MFKKLVLIASAAACVAVLGVGVAVVVRARNTSASNACVTNLRQLDGVKETWALDNSKTTNDVPIWEAIRPYLPQREQEAKPIGPVCPQGGTYSLRRVGERPTCSLGGPGHTLK